MIRFLLPHDPQRRIFIAAPRVRLIGQTQYIKWTRLLILIRVFLHLSLSHPE